MKVVDIKQETFKRAKPGLGSIEMEKGARMLTHEYEVAKWFVEEFGGNLVKLKEEDGKNTPDFRLDETFLEVKHINGSETSIGNALRKARKQLEMGGICVLFIENTDRKMKDIKRDVITRMTRYGNKSVMIKSSKGLVAHYVIKGK